MLYVVRHGQSVFNSRNLVCGRSNAPLTDKGREQALFTGEKLASVRFDYAFASPLDRARDTALAILSYQESAPELVINPLIIERDAGLFEGDQKDVEHDFPFWRPDFDCEAVGYETRQSVVARVQEFLAEIGDIYKTKNVLVVAHNGIVRAFRHIFENIPYDVDWLEYGAPNAGFVVFQ